MESILHQVYTAYAFERPSSPELRACYDKLEPYFTRLQTELGEKFEAEFRTALYHAEEREFEEWFRLGAVLTGRLLWELLDGAESPRLYF